MVFVLAPPRSGSTLLRVMLGGHPRLFAPPELELLSYEDLTQRKAALGERSSSWVLEGFTRAIMALMDCHADEAERTIRDWESRRLSTIECYGIVQDWLGSRTLVDKTASYSLNLSTLNRAEAAFHRPLYIHLLRHPRAVVHSFEKVGLDQIVLADQQHDFPVRELGESMWLNSHQNILEFLGSVPTDRQHRVTFEELVNRPQSTLEGLCRFLGMPFHPGMLQPYEDPETLMTDGIRPGSRMVGDPRFLAKDEIDPQAADRWRLESRDGSLGDISWRLAESLGYQRTGRSPEQGQASSAHGSAPKRSEPQGSGAKPCSRTEKEVAGIWAEVLGLEEVGVDDDFFELGGSSLRAARVMRRLNSRFAVDLPVRTLFERPTVAGLALSIPRAGDQAQAFPLSPGQRDVWFGEQRRPGLYPGTLALRLKGPLDVAALASSLEEICARHEPLRTTFGTRGGDPVQTVGPPYAVSPPQSDLRALAPASRETEAARLLAGEIERPFDLAGDPMLRTRLLRLDDDEHLLLLVIHHIACDAWSLDVLLRELELLYGAARSGRQADVPEPPIQYADYVAWQRERRQDGTLRASAEYWRGRLAQPPKALDLSPYRPHRPVRTSGGAWRQLRMPSSLSRSLDALGRRHHITLFVTLLSAWATLLHRYSGQDDILILTPFANRQRVELEGLVGFFANNLALRAEFGGDPSFREVLERTRRTVVEALSHGEVPFGELPEDARSAVTAGFFLPPRSTPRLDGLDVARIEMDHGARVLPLGLFIIRQDHGLTARLNYARSELAGATAAGMLDNYIRLLQRVLVDPERPVSMCLTYTETC